jgi:hypothetical protein
MKRRIFFVSAIVSLGLLSQVSCTPSSGYTLPTRTSIEPTITVTEKTTQTEVASTGIQPPLSIRVTKLHEWLLSKPHVYAIKWAPRDDKFVVLSAEDTTMYDASTYQEVWSFPPIAPAYYASGAVFSPDGKSLVLYVGGSGLQVLDSQSGQLLAQKTMDNNPGGCLQTEASKTILDSDGQTFFINTQNLEKPSVSPEIQIWNLLSLQCTGVFAKTEGHTRSLDLSSDGKFLALGVGLDTAVSSSNEVIENGRITIWNLETKKQTCSIDHQGSFASFKPASSLLIVADPTMYKLTYWNVTTCSSAQELIGITTHYGLTYSPDGQLLAIWNDGIWILDANSGKVLQKISDPAPSNIFPIDRLNSFISFSPDGRFLLYSIHQLPSESLIFLWELEK